MKKIENVKVKKGGELAQGPYRSRHLPTFESAQEPDGDSDRSAADEPTTALDVTAQSDVMAILDEQRRARGLALLFITHDLELAAACCDRLAVMYAGEIVEQGPHVYDAPTHPYTVELMGARPSIEERVARLPVLTYNREIHEQLKAEA